MLLHVYDLNLSNWTKYLIEFYNSNAANVFGIKQLMDACIYMCMQMSI